MANSIYIHIPFCNNICSYCDFCKLLYDKFNVNSYLDSLEYEINSSYKGELVNTLYIGGGTPSALSIDELNRLFDIIKVFNINDNLEFSIEVNVNDINEEMLKLFKDNKVNRLSIGIETVNDKYLSFLNRNHSKEDVTYKIEMVKKYFDNFSVDLMYAFPNQKLEEVMSDLSFVVKLNPKHISIYSLIIEEHTKIYLDGVEPIDDEIESSMYSNIISYLKDNNYDQYEISNFSKDGYESKHNLVYWNNQEYYGFGLSASGYLNNVRYTNTRSISNYLKHKFILNNEIIDTFTSMENELIFGLRKTNGISINDFYNKYNKSVFDVFNITELINKNLLEVANDRLYIPKDKLYVSNYILVNFIGGSKNDN